LLQPKDIYNLAIDKKNQRNFFYFFLPISSCCERTHDRMIVIGNENSRETIANIRQCSQIIFKFIHSIQLVLACINSHVILKKFTVIYCSKKEGVHPIFQHKETIGGVLRKSCHRMLYIIATVQVVVIYVD
jgi:hypothetical protein